MIETWSIDQWKAKGRLLAETVARTLALTGATPNVITLIGVVLNGLVALVVAAGFFTIGGVLLLAVALFDAIDGALARVTNQKTRFGAFLDSTTDRYAEAFILLGVLYAFHENATVTILAYIVIVGSLLVSYTRARAEGLGLRCEVGMLARPERVIILALGLITGLIIPALAVLAVFTHLTTIQRMVHVYRLTGGR
jgi:CDP-diacylglycerol---glycerol-3-phosphate 3-phosphatidyltransferase